MINKVKFNTFVKSYKTALKSQRTTTAQVTRNLGKSKSYLYNLLKNYNHREYINIDTVKQIGFALGFNVGQVRKWLHSMVMEKLVHPIHQQNGVSHHHMRKINKKKQNRRLHRIRYNEIGKVIGKLHKLDLNDIKKVNAIVAIFTNPSFK